jgi:hypothetical protein
VFGSYCEEKAYGKEVAGKILILASLEEKFETIL